MESVGDIAERVDEVVGPTIDLSASESNDEARITAAHRKAVETIAPVSVGFDDGFLYTPPPSPCPRGEPCPCGLVRMKVRLHADPSPEHHIRQ
ncbi:MAG: hypothetical protein LZF60_330003 [Nitrospira sp.]|nr:MAG: hypothetical protein LZF60_330003 [Nitrospira sp.]